MSYKNSNAKNISCNSKPVNFLTLLVQSQVDTQLGALLCGTNEHVLFHVHNLTSVNLFLQRWSENPLSANHFLVLSFSDLNDITLGNIEQEIRNINFSPVFLSNWNRNSLLGKEIIIADERKWYAAICASAVASHLFSTHSFYFWQAVSSGSVITRNQQYTKFTSEFIPVIKSIETTDNIIKYWIALVDQPSIRRTASDAIRKIFWSERREAEKQKNELLQRVFDW